MAIDIGYGADSLPASGLPAAWTLIDCNNAANADGTLTSFQIYAPANFTGTKMGTFSGNGTTTFEYRDHEVIGNVTGGSKQTFSGLSCTVVTGDYLGLITATGEPRNSTTGGSGMSYYAGDYFEAGSHDDYTANANRWMPVYGTGGGWLGTIRIGNQEIVNPAAIRIGNQEFTAAQISKMVIGKGEI